MSRKDDLQIYGGAEFAAALQTGMTVPKAKSTKIKGRATTSKKITAGKAGGGPFCVRESSPTPSSGSFGERPTSTSKT